MSRRILFVFLLLAFAFLESRPSFAFKTFSERWSEQRRPKQARPRSTQLHGKHVLFVAGFLNEGMSGYLTENAEAVRQLGGTATIFHPNSNRSITANVKDLAKKIEEIYSTTNRPITLVGHSKGGAEVLYLLLSQPQLVLESHQVDGAILIQAAIGGSPIAKKVSDSKIAQLLPNKLLGGLYSLVPEEDHHIFLNAYDLFKKSLPYPRREEFHRRIFYVQGYQDSNKVVRELRKTHHYLEEQGQAKHGNGRNDGLMLLEDQIFAPVGRVLAVVKADHAALTLKNPLLSTSRGSDIRAFTRAMFLQVLSTWNRDQALARGPQKGEEKEEVLSVTDASWNVCDSSRLPKEVIFRGPTETYNRLYDFAVDRENLCFKSRTSSQWNILPVLPEMEGRIREISADDKYLIATTDDRVMYTMHQALNEKPSDFNWSKRWGTPIFRGKGMKIPSDTIAFALSHVSPSEDKTYMDHTGTLHYLGAGVTSLYALREGGQKITLLDPWLPADTSFQFTTPKRGRFRAVSMSAGGTGILVMNEHGDLFAIRKDFDIAGHDELFAHAAYETHKHQHNTFLTKFFSARKLPLPDWMQISKVPGPITHRISMQKEGFDLKTRLIRVEGRQGEQTGYYETHIDFVPNPDAPPPTLSEVNWKFFPTHHIIAPEDFIENYQPDRDTSDEGLGTNDDRVFQSKPNEDMPFHITISEMSPHCSPAKIQVSFKGETRGSPLELILHTTHHIHQHKRNEEEAFSHVKLRGKIQVPLETWRKMSQLPKTHTTFIQKYLKSKEFRSVEVEIDGSHLKLERPSPLPGTKSIHWDLEQVTQ